MMESQHIGETFIKAILDMSGIPAQVKNLKVTDPIKVGVDATQLHDLNKLYDVKQRHHRETADYVKRNPIAPNVNLGELHKLNKELDLVSKARSVSVNLDSLERAYAQADSIGNRLRDRNITISADVQFNEDQVRRAHRQIIVESEVVLRSEEPKRRSEKSDNSSPEPKRRSKKSDNSSPGILSGLQQEIGRDLKRTISSALYRNFDFDTKKVANKVADKILTPVKVFITDNAELKSSLKRTSDLIDDRLRKTGYVVGEAIVAGLDANNGRIQDRINAIIKSVAPSVKPAAKQAAKDVADVAKDTASSIANKGVAIGVLDGVDRAIRSYKEGAIRDVAIPKALERAAEIKAKGKSSNTGNSVDEDTKELFIASGGYAGARGLSGKRLATDIRKDIDKDSKVIWVQNSDSDIPKESMGKSVKKAQALVTSMSKPTLRGYSKDAVEMMAQSIVAVEKNPEIHIKLVAESGGGDAAQEAAKGLKMMGYKNVSYIGVGTPDFIGGHSDAPGKKIISPDEYLGTETHRLYGKLGLAKTGKDHHNILGVEGHPYEHYKEAGVAELQNFIKGKPEPLDNNEITEIKKAADQFAAIDLTGMNSKELAKTAKQAHTNLQAIRRHIVDAVGEPNKELVEIAKTFESVFVAASPESRSFTQVRTAVKTAKGLLDKISEQPGVEAAQTAKQINKELTQIQSEFKAQNKNQTGTTGRKYASLNGQLNELIAKSSGSSFAVPMGAREGSAVPVETPQELGAIVRIEPRPAPLAIPERAKELVVQTVNVMATGTVNIVGKALSAAYGVEKAALGEGGAKAVNMLAASAVASNLPGGHEALGALGAGLGGLAEMPLSALAGQSAAQITAFIGEAVGHVPMLKALAPQLSGMITEALAGGATSLSATIGSVAAPFLAGHGLLKTAQLMPGLDGNANKGISDSVENFILGTLGNAARIGRGVSRNRKQLAPSKQKALPGSDLHADIWDAEIIDVKALPTGKPRSYLGGQRMLPPATQQIPSLAGVDAKKTDEIIAKANEIKRIISANKKRILADLNSGDISRIERGLEDAEAFGHGLAYLKGEARLLAKDAQSQRNQLIAENPHVNKRSGPVADLLNSKQRAEGFASDKGAQTKKIEEKIKEIAKNESLVSKINPSLKKGAIGAGVFGSILAALTTGAQASVVGGGGAAVGGGLLAALSPFLIPALGVAGVGAAGYAGYKALNKKQPEISYTSEIDVLTKQQAAQRAEIKKYRSAHDNFKKIKANLPSENATDEEHSIYDKARTEAFSASFEARDAARDKGVDLRETSQRLKRLKQKQAEIVAQPRSVEPIRESFSQKFERTLADFKNTVSEAFESTHEGIVSKWNAITGRVRNRIAPPTIPITPLGRAIAPPTIPVAPQRVIPAAIGLAQDAFAPSVNPDEIEKTLNIRGKFSALGKMVGAGLIGLRGKFSALGKMVGAGLIGLIGLHFVPALVGFIGQIASQSFQKAMQAENLNLTLKAVSTSSSDAQKTVNSASSTAKILGTSQLDAIASAAQFKASINNTGLEGRGDQITTGLAKFGRVNGVTGERLKLSQMALSQMAGKENIMAEEVFGQLAESLPGGAVELAAANGMTVKQLRALMKGGGAQASKMLPAFGQRINAIGDLNMQSIKNSPTTQIGRLGDSVEQLQLKVGSEALPTMGIGATAARKAIELLTGSMDTLIKLGITGLVMMSGKFISMIPGIDAIGVALAKIRFEGFGGLKTAIAPLLKDGAIMAGLYLAGNALGSIFDRMTGTNAPNKQFRDDMAAAAASTEKIVNDLKGINPEVSKTTVADRTEARYADKLNDFDKVLNFVEAGASALAGEGKKGEKSVNFATQMRKDADVEQTKAAIDKIKQSTKDLASLKPEDLSSPQSQALRDNANKARRDLLLDKGNDPALTKKLTQTKLRSDTELDQFEGKYQTALVNTQSQIKGLKAFISDPYYSKDKAFAESIKDAKAELPKLIEFEAGLTKQRSKESLQAIKTSESLELMTSKMAIAKTQIDRQRVVASDKLTVEFSGSLSTGSKIAKQYEIDLAAARAETTAARKLANATEAALKAPDVAPDVAALQKAGRLPDNLEDTTKDQLELIKKENLASENSIKSIETYQSASAGQRESFAKENTLVAERRKAIAEELKASKEYFVTSIAQIKLTEIASTEATREFTNKSYSSQFKGALEGVTSAVGSYVNDLITQFGMMGDIAKIEADKAKTLTELNLQEFNAKKIRDDRQNTKTVDGSSSAESSGSGNPSGSSVVVSPLASASLEQLVNYQPGKIQGFNAGRKGRDKHGAVDFDGRIGGGTGATVQSPISGMATRIGLQEGYGDGVWVDGIGADGKPVKVKLNHLDPASVKELFGEDYNKSVQVKAGQAVGRVAKLGASAKGAADHLDNVVIIDGEKVDPQDWYRSQMGFAKVNPGLLAQANKYNAMDLPKATGAVGGKEILLSAGHWSDANSTEPGEGLKRKSIPFLGSGKQSVTAEAIAAKITVGELVAIGRAKGFNVTDVTAPINSGRTPEAEALQAKEKAGATAYQIHYDDMESGKPGVISYDRVKSSSYGEEGLRKAYGRHTAVNDPSRQQLAMPKRGISIVEIAALKRNAGIGQFVDKYIETGDANYIAQAQKYVRENEAEKFWSAFGAAPAPTTTLPTSGKKGDTFGGNKPANLIETGNALGGIQPALLDTTLKYIAKLESGGNYYANNTGGTFPKSEAIGGFPASQIKPRMIAGAIREPNIGKYQFNVTDYKWAQKYDPSIKDFTPDSQNKIAKSKIAFGGRGGAEMLAYQNNPTLENADKLRAALGNEWEVARNGVEKYAGRDLRKDIWNRNGNSTAKFNEALKASLGKSKPLTVGRLAGKAESSQIPLAPSISTPPVIPVITDPLAASSGSPSADNEAVYNAQMESINTQKEQIEKRTRIAKDSAEIALKLAEINAIIKKGAGLRKEKEAQFMAVQKLEQDGDKAGDMTPERKRSIDLRDAKFAAGSTVRKANEDRLLLMDEKLRLKQTEVVLRSVNRKDFTQPELAKLDETIKEIEPAVKNIDVQLTDSAKNLLKAQELAKKLDGYTALVYDRQTEKDLFAISVSQRQRNEQKLGGDLTAAKTFAEANPFNYKKGDPLKIQSEIDLSALKRSTMEEIQQLQEKSLTASIPMKADIKDAIDFVTNKYIVTSENIKSKLAADLKKRGSDEAAYIMASQSAVIESSLSASSAQSQLYAAQGRTGVAKQREYSDGFTKRQLENAQEITRLNKMLADDPSKKNDVTQMRKDLDARYLLGQVSAATQFQRDQDLKLKGLGDSVEGSRIETVRGQAGLLSSSGNTYDARNLEKQAAYRSEALSVAQKMREFDVQLLAEVPGSAEAKAIEQLRSEFQKLSEIKLDGLNQQFSQFKGVIDQTSGAFGSMFDKAIIGQATNDDLFAFLRAPFKAVADELSNFTKSAMSGVFRQALGGITGDLNRMMGGVTASNGTQRALDPIGVLTRPGIGEGNPVPVQIVGGDFSIPPMPEDPLGANEAGRTLEQSAMAAAKSLVMGGQMTGDFVSQGVGLLGDLLLGGQQKSTIGSSNNLFGTLMGGIGKLFGFAEGGYTGSGGKYEPAGIVHKDEYVFDAASTKRIGVANLESMRAGIKGYYSGGLVTGASLPSLAPYNNILPSPRSIPVQQSAPKMEIEYQEVAGVPYVKLEDFKVAMAQNQQQTRQAFSENQRRNDDRARHSLAYQGMM